MRRLALFLIASALLLPACGKKGDPLPPLRDVPKRTEDLAVSQKGGELVLQMGFPQSTADGRPLPGIEAVEVWELAIPGVADAAAGPRIEPDIFGRQATRRLALRGAELAAMTTGDQLVARLLAPEVGSEPRLLVMAVRTVATGGETSAFSNLVRLVLRTPPAPPSALAATALPDGIELRWTGPAEPPVASRIYRRFATERGYSRPAAEVEGSATSWVDRSVRYGERYIYTVTTVGSKQPLIEGPIASEVEVAYDDRFAPAAPTRLLALPEPGRTRLVWESSEASDVASYRVWRQDPRAEWRLVASGLTDTEHIDGGLTPGLSYRYRVEAVDARGNIGPASDEATVLIP
jgi:hypothetical protein